ncbi:MAG: 6-phosphogluconolactonase [Acidobacteriaceae bacterium]|nr:6-phosphogluconolactonase [Acidobacteriaceae bacterium]
MLQPVTVTFFVSSTPTALAMASAQFFLAKVTSAVEARGVARIAISGGSTPQRMFALLADSSQPYAKQVPWDKLDLYWVDERSVPPDHADSNYKMAEELLLSKIPLARSRVHRIEGELKPEEAAARYEAAIRKGFQLKKAETPAFDLILLGMGDDGHTASLFPHTTALDETERLAVANHVPQKDSWRITLTWPVINQGREVAFLVEGASKAQVLHDCLLGPYQPEVYPAQLIRPASGRLTFLLDSAAVSKLPLAGLAGQSNTLELR